MKKFYVAIVVFLMLFSLEVFAASSAGELLEELGVIQGTEKGLEEDKLLTREELITILVRIARVDGDMYYPEKATFKDMPRDHWAYEYVEGAYGMGMTKGIGNGYFGTGKYVTYKEVLAMTMRLMWYEFDYEDTIEFADKIKFYQGPYDEELEVSRGLVFNIIVSALNTKTADGSLFIDENIYSFGEDAIEKFKADAKKFISWKDSGYGSNDKQDPLLQLPITEEIAYDCQIHINIDYYDFVGTFSDMELEYIESREFEYQGSVYLDEPYTDGYAVESNPFHFSIFGCEEQTGLEGDLSLVSSLVVFVNEEGVEYLGQYWNLSLDGKDLSGQLVDTLTAEGMALNIVWIMKDYYGFKLDSPTWMGLGTELEGVVTANRIDVSIEGKSRNELYGFQVHVDGDR